jgi:Flp pilus assembly pilin Flp
MGPESWHFCQNRPRNHGSRPTARKRWKKVFAQIQLLDMDSRRSWRCLKKPWGFQTAATIQGLYAITPNGDRSGTEAVTKRSEAVCNQYEQLLRKGNTMMNLFASFKNDESGAVTVDWVVLTAAVVGLSLALMVAIRPALTGTAGNIATQITAAGTAIAP